jgi:hypothetical protein
VLDSPRFSSNKSVGVKTSRIYEIVYVKIKRSVGENMYENMHENMQNKIKKYTKKIQD